MITTKRKAACCPFQTSDCHIKNHSPPMVINPENHKIIPNVNPSIAIPLASLKPSGSYYTFGFTKAVWVLYDLNRRKPPSQHKTAIAASTKIRTT